MSKLRLVGLAEDKNKILDELYLQQCAHIKSVEQVEGTKIVSHETEERELAEQISKCKSAVDILVKVAEKDEGEISCSFKHFVGQEKNAEKMNKLVGEVTDYIDKINALYNKIMKCRSEQLDIVPMDIRKLNSINLNVEKKTLENSASETKKILDKIYHSLLSVTETYIFGEYERLEIKSDSENDLFIPFKIRLEDYNNLLITLKKYKLVITKKDEAKGVVEFYYSFKRAMPEFYKEVQKRIAELEKRITEYEAEILSIYQKLKGYLPRLNLLKIYTDYLSYKLESIKAEDEMCQTDSTCMLECFVPKKQVANFKRHMKSKFSALVISDEKITEQDETPTKLTGDKITSSANFVVNMYSVPKYGEADPTFSVFFFFVIFFGFIMADVGYGIVLTLIGFLLAARSKAKSKKGGSAQHLWFLIGIGGMFAIIWGALFGSYFGFSHSDIDFLPEGVMPSPQNEPIPLLLFCLLMGVCQIVVGFIMRGINYFKHGKISEGIVNGFAWAVCLIGVVFWSANKLLAFFNLEIVGTVGDFFTMVEPAGLIIMLTGLAVGVIFAGIGSRGFTKFTKSFSAIYGLLNLFSDILSYARLFGLMLSSAIIAQQFNMIGMEMMNGVVGTILGTLVILIGHSFNVAMGALSAYIHDVRLQYVEYFGKFYEGEGVPFTPFGAQLSYVKIVDDGRN